MEGACCPLTPGIDWNPRIAGEKIVQQTRIGSPYPFLPELCMAALGSSSPPSKTDICI